MPRLTCAFGALLSCSLRVAVFACAFTLTARPPHTSRLRPQPNARFSGAKNGLAFKGKRLFGHPWSFPYADGNSLVSLATHALSSSHYVPLNCFYVVRSPARLFSFSWCLDGALPAGSRFPLPPLYMDQFRATVACLVEEAGAAAGAAARDGAGNFGSRGSASAASVIDLVDRQSVSTIVCEGEADLDLACACSAFKQHHQLRQQHPHARHPRVFVLGEDSDFLVYRDCHYVNFRALSLVPGVGTRHALYAARVFHPTLLAEALGFPEGDAGLLRLCDLAVLLGNDYSAELTANAWDWPSAAAGMSDYIGILNVNNAGASRGGIVTESERLSSINGPPSNALRNPSLLVEWLAARSDKWQLVGKTPHAAHVLAYSRALYCDLDSNRAASVDAQARVSSDFDTATEGITMASDGDFIDDGDGTPPVPLPLELIRKTTLAVPTADSAAAAAAGGGNYEGSWTAATQAALARAGADRSVAARELISLAMRALVAGGNREWSADWARAASAAVDAAVSRAATSALTHHHRADNPLVEDKVHERPEWRNVVAAHQLQVACARLLASAETPIGLIGGGSGKAQVWRGAGLGLEPRHFYHGPAFLNAISLDRNQIPPQPRLQLGVMPPMVDDEEHRAEKVSNNPKLMPLLKQFSCESAAGDLAAGGIQTVEDLVLASDHTLAKLGLKKGSRLKIGKWQRDMKVAGLKSISHMHRASRAEEEEDEDHSDSEDFLLGPASASLHGFRPSGSLPHAEKDDSDDEELVFRTGSLSLRTADKSQQPRAADQQVNVPNSSMGALGLSEQATQYLHRLSALAAQQAAPTSSHSKGNARSTGKSSSLWTAEQWDRLDEEQKQIATTLPTLKSSDLAKYESMSKDQLREECVSRGLRKKGVPKLYFPDVLKTRIIIYERSVNSPNFQGIDTVDTSKSRTGNSLDITGDMAKLTLNGRVIIWNFQEWESLAPDDRRAVATLATSSREELQRYDGMFNKQLKVECTTLGLPVTSVFKLALVDILKARLVRYSKTSRFSKIIDSLPSTPVPENHDNKNYNKTSSNLRKEFHTMSKAELVAECTRHGLPKEGTKGVLVARLSLNACAACGERGHTTPQCRNSRLPRPPHAPSHVQRDAAARAPPPSVTPGSAATSNTAVHSWSVPGAGKLPIDDHAERICNYVATHRVFRCILYTFIVFAS